MQFKDFLNKRKTELKYSLSDIADKVHQGGYEISVAGVGHWSTGRSVPDLSDYVIRTAIAMALQVDVNEMMEQLGYIVYEHARSKEAQLAAAIVDQLPDDKKRLAIGILEQIRQGA